MEFSTRKWLQTSSRRCPCPLVLVVQFSQDLVVVDLAKVCLMSLLTSPHQIVWEFWESECKDHQMSARDSQFQREPVTTLAESCSLMKKITKVLASMTSAASASKTIFQTLRIQASRSPSTPSARVPTRAEASFSQVIVSFCQAIAYL